MSGKIEPIRGYVMPVSYPQDQTISISDRYKEFLAQEAGRYERLRKLIEDGTDPHIAFRLCYPVSEQAK